MSVTVTDLFCGAAGSSLGAEAAGMTLTMAANHCPLPRRRPRLDARRSPRVARTATPRPCPCGRPPSEHDQPHAPRDVTRGTRAWT